MPSKYLGLMLPALALALGGCGGTVPGTQVCTAIFASATVSLVDSANAPVADATVTATLVRTGEVLAPTAALPLVAGTYDLFDDGSRSKLRVSGDSIRVLVQRQTRSKAVMYFYDVPGGCHINKVSGPSIIVAP
jgi:hypothetical protein